MKKRGRRMAPSSVSFNNTVTAKKQDPVPSPTG